MTASCGRSWPKKSASRRWPSPRNTAGAGFTWFETGLVLEALGYHLAPSPLLSSAVLAAAAVLHAGDEADRERLLPGIAEGSTLATLAWADGLGKWNTAGSGIAGVRPGRTVDA